MASSNNNVSAQEQKLLSARRLITFANIAGPVSIIIGGVILSGAGLICAFIARRKINDLLNAECAPSEAFKQRILTAARPGAVALVICAIALILNAISVAIMMPILLSAMQSGDIQTLIGGSGTNAATSITSTWG